MSRYKIIKLIVLIILVVVILVSIILGLTKSNKKDIKSIKKTDSYVVNKDVNFNIEDTKQYTVRKLRFNLPKEFKKKRVANNVYKFTISTKEEKGTLTIIPQITKSDAKTFMIDELGFKKDDKFKNKKINKVVWLKVKKNNIYGYGLKQRGLVYGIRYDYSKSKKIAKSVPSILEKTMYLRIYYNDKKTK